MTGERVLATSGRRARQCSASPPPPALTVLQSRHRVRLRSEVAVADIVGRFQAQLVGGEGAQPGRGKGEDNGGGFQGAVSPAGLPGNPKPSLWRPTRSRPR